MSYLRLYVVFHVAAIGMESGAFELFEFAAPHPDFGGVAYGAGICRLGQNIVL